MGLVDYVGNMVSESIDTVQRKGKELYGAIQAEVQPENRKQTNEKIAAQQKYGYTYLKYPLILGDNTRHPHYITFFVNIRNLSKYADSSPLGKRAKDEKGNFIESTVAINQRSRPGITGRSMFGGTFGFNRKTSRTTVGIRLYMPDTLSWSFQNQFSESALSSTLPGMALGVAGASDSAIKSIKELIDSGGDPAKLASLSKKGNEFKALGAEAVGRATGDVNFALNTFGMALNPQIDVIYETPVLRSFNFEFIFAPRSQEEGKAVYDIIQAFKFHAAPEILKGGGVFGRYFVPPSDFDIEFSNQKMGKISSCVLEDITVDYGATGSAFYRDDMPVHTRLTLRFKELEYITKELIHEKGY